MRLRLQIERSGQFYKSVLAIALPVALLNIFNFSVGMVDSVMLGQLGETAMAASSLGNQVFAIVNSVTYGTTGAAATLLSQYWGKRDLAAIPKVIAACMRYTFLICLAASVVVFLQPVAIMRIFSSDMAVIAAGAGYLRIYSLSYALYAISITLITSLRAIENVRVPMLINMLSYSLNIGFNYCLIFGKFGLPALGITGAAIGTLCARIIELLALIIYCKFFEKTVHITLGSFFCFDRGIEHRFFRLLVPITITEVLFGVGSTMYPLVFGRLDTGAMAAYSVSYALQQLCTSLTFALCSAACVLIGKAVGEGDRQKVMAQSKAFHLMCWAVGFLSGAFLYFGKNWLLGLYAITPETMAVTDNFLTLSALTLPIVAMEGMYAAGTLRGGGDATFNMIFTNLCLWGIGIPLVFIAGFVLHWPMWAVFLLTKSYYLITALCCLVRFYSGKWIKDVTADGKFLKKTATEPS